MHKKLTNRHSRRKTKRSIEKHGIFRRKHAIHLVTPITISLKIFQNRHWYEAIIRARLANVMSRMNYRGNTILKTEQILGFKSMFSSVVLRKEYRTIHFIDDASNDANYVEPSTKEVLYVFA